MSCAAANRLQTIRSNHPEWNPWLTVVARTLTEASNPRWESFVPAARREERVPALAEAAIALPLDLLAGWTKQVVRSAAGSGTPAMATLKAAAKLPSAVAVQLFRAALCQDSATIEQLARECGVDAGAFRGIADLLPIPFLQACGRRFGNRNAGSWQEGYCPTCGAWPALAEVRGIERARYLRCGRCGDEWQVHWLQCPFCGTSDHEQWTKLVPQSGEACTADACRRCAGYLKSFTLLQGADPLGVMVSDLASVDLDIAAIEQGYRRPKGPAYALNATLRCNESLLGKFFHG